MATQKTLSFIKGKFQGIGEDEFLSLVNAEKGVNAALEAVNKARETQENATTKFLKKIGAYNKNAKPTKTAMESGPVFVTNWIVQFFDNWPQVKRPGRNAEPAAIGNENVKGLFTPEEHSALVRAYNALAQAIKKAKTPKPAEQGQDKPAEQGQDKPAEQGQDKPAEQGQNKPAEQGQNKPAEQGQNKPAVAVTATKKAIFAQEQATLEWVLAEIEKAEDLEDLKTSVAYALKKTKERIKKAA